MRATRRLGVSTMSLLLPLGVLLTPAPAPSSVVGPRTTPRAEEDRVQRFEGAGSRTLRINEVLYRPGRGDPEFVEIYNAGSRSISLDGWFLTDAGHRFVAALPAGRLEPGGHTAFAPKASKGRGALRAATGGAGTTNALSDERDAVALYKGSLRKRGLKDLVAWTEVGKAPKGRAYRHAVRKGMWPRRSAFESVDLDTLKMTHPVRNGESIGRDRVGRDRDLPADWAVLGGIDALEPTPGEPNRSRMLDFNSPGSARSELRGSDQLGPQPQREWTVMVYMDPADERTEGPVQNEITQMARSGSNADVNVVAQIGYREGRTYRIHVTKDVNIRRQASVVPAGVAVDPGDPASLTAFTTWARANFPAERYMLIMVGHGQGWKGIMNSSRHGNLSMPELRTALTGFGAPFDVVFYHSCLMGQVEVAHQTAGAARTMVASEEILWDHFQWEAFLDDLKANADWTASQVAVRTAERYANGARSRRNRTIAAIDLGSFAANLTQLVPPFAAALAADVETLVGRDQRKDNLQVSMRKDAQQKAESFEDDNFVDLYHFAELIQGLGGTAAAQVPPIRNALTVGGGGSVLLFENHGSGHEGAHGLSIYMPEHQTHPDGGRDDRPFDHPEPAVHLYKEDPAPLIPGLGGGHPVAEDAAFLWPAASNWHVFLYRFYKPVADACARTPEGCVPVVKAKVGETVTLSGEGSSDIDGPADAHRPEHVNGEQHWYWDLDIDTDHPGPVPAYDPSIRQDCPDEDCDRDAADDADDDRDAAGQTVTFTCTELGEFRVRLMVWDEHHDLDKKSLPGDVKHFVHFNVDDDFVTVKCEGKVADDSSAAPGDEIVYRISLVGDATLEVPTDAFVNDPLPEGTTFTGEFFCSSGNCSYDPETRTFRWEGTLEGLEVVDILIHVQVDPTIDCDTVLVNRAATFDGVSQEDFEVPVSVDAGEGC